MKKNEISLIRKIPDTTAFTVKKGHQVLTGITHKEIHILNVIVATLLDIQLRIAANIFSVIIVDIRAVSSTSTTYLREQMLKGIREISQNLSPKLITRISNLTKLK